MSEEKPRIALDIAPSMVERINNERTDREPEAKAETLADMYNRHMRRSFERTLRDLIVTCDEDAKGHVLAEWLRDPGVQRLYDSAEKAAEVFDCEWAFWQARKK